jgi:hypothetical protein
VKFRYNISYKEGWHMTETEKKLNQIIKGLDKNIRKYTNLIENKNGYFLESNIIYFKKERAKFRKQKIKIQQEYPEYFI